MDNNSINQGSFYDLDMKNISLYTLKLILSVLLSIGFFMSCTEKDPELDMHLGSQAPAATEVLVRLLIKGETILPPKTKQMDPSIEGSFKDALKLLILKEKTDGTNSIYHYECSRPVETTKDGGFAVKVPISLNGSNLKFLLFANDSDLIKDPDTQFKKDGIGISEEAIRKILILTQNTRWPTGGEVALPKAIPMWGEDQFTFTVSDDGVTSPTIAHLKLLRMLARVDVGVAYDGNNLASTAIGLIDFKIKEVKVHHTSNKGQLIPNPDSYIKEGEGADKVINIISASIPEGEINKISPYGITFPDGVDACERYIYIFEQDMLQSDPNFNIIRPCILVKGTYIDPVNKKPIDGWYRLDFRNFGTDVGYEDVLRNKLYRFNITKVKGPGFSSESDALKSVASNITVQLTPMELQQNDVTIDGQSFLTVNKSELFFYRDRLKTSLSLDTDNASGWKIDLNGVTDVTVTPAESKKKGSAVVEFTWNTVPSKNESKTIYIRVANLRKPIVLKYIDENAPGSLTKFSLTPSVLYFLKDGGTGFLSVDTDIDKKNVFFKPFSDRVDISVPSTASDKNRVPITVARYNASAIRNNIEGGAVNVTVKAANADVSAECVIKQFTIEKQINCTPSIMSSDLLPGKDKSELSVKYQTNEDDRAYRIEFRPEAGAGGSNFEIDSKKSEEGEVSVTVTASANKKKTERKVGELVFHPQLDGKKISIVDHVAKKVEIRQEGVPAPVLYFDAFDKVQFDWNERSFGFNTGVSNLQHVNGNNIRISKSNNNINFPNFPSNGTLGQLVNVELPLNRTGADKQTDIIVQIDGYDGLKSESRKTITQKAPTSSTEPGDAKDFNVRWDETTAKLSLNNLNQIFDVVVAGKEMIPGDSYTELPVDVSTGSLFTMAPDKESAFLDLRFGQNNSSTKRRVKIQVKATGNILSEEYYRDFIISQDARIFSGSLSLSPVRLDFTRNETSEKHSVITKNHINEVVRVDRSNIPSWVTARIDEDRLVIVPTENLGDARTGAVYIYAPDATGVERRASVQVHQASNIVRVSNQKQESPYNYNEGGGSDQIHASHYVNIEANSLPFTKFSAEPDSRSNLSYFLARPSAIPDRVGKQVEITVIPNKRENAYGNLEIPITMNFETSQGVKSTAKLTVIRKGVPDPVINARISSTYTNVQPLNTYSVEGYLKTENLKTDGFLTVKTYMTDTHSVQVSQINGAPIPNNYEGPILVTLRNLSDHIVMNGTLIVYGEGVDGSRREIFKMKGK